MAKSVDLSLVFCLTIGEALEFLVLECYLLMLQRKNIAQHLLLTTLLGR